jgi:hypothetical protein
MILRKRFSGAREDQWCSEKVVPVERIELPTFGLQNRCSTAELNRQMRECEKILLVVIARRNRWRLAEGAVKYQSCPPRATGERLPLAGLFHYPAPGRPSGMRPPAVS